MSYPFLGMGELFLTSVSTGVVTPDELRWVALNQFNFNKSEQAIALKLGQLVDSDQLALGQRF